MEEGGSSVPGDTGLPATAAAARPGSPLEAVVAEAANTDCSGCESMASTAVGDDDMPRNQQTVGSELFSDSWHPGRSLNPFKRADPKPEDNVGTIPVNNHAHCAVESVCEEKMPASILDPADVAGPVGVGFVEDGVYELSTFSLLPTVSQVELQNSSGTGVGACTKSYSNGDDDSSSLKEFASTAGGPGIIDGSAASADACQLEGQVHSMLDSDGDQIKEYGINGITSKPTENGDSTTACHCERVVEDVAEDAHGLVADVFLVGSVQSLSEGRPVQGSDAIEVHQIDGSRGNPSEPTVKPIGTEDSSTHFSGHVLEEFVQKENQDSVLSMHTGENALQSATCTLPEKDYESVQMTHKEERDTNSVQMTHKEERDTDSSAKIESGNTDQGARLLAHTGENALQETSGACSITEKGLHLALEEESLNDSRNKVEMRNSCPESLATEPSCSHVEESPSYHVHRGSDAPDSCHFTENAICGNIGSSYHDRHENEGTCSPNLHLFRDQSGFQVQESSATYLQPLSIPADSCLFPQDVATFAGTCSDENAKSTPKNGASNTTTTDPVSVPRRRNPVRAAHSKSGSTCVKSPIQTSTAKKSSKTTKAKKKKTPVSRTLVSVSFGNTTKKRNSHRVGRSCGWGTIESVHKVFENSAFFDLPSELARIARATMVLREGNGRKRSNSRKARKGSTVECVSAENSSTQNDLRNSQVVFSRFADPRDSENLEHSGSGQIRTCPEIEHALNTHSCSQGQFSPCHMKLDKREASSAGDAHIGDKDLESSVTLETSNENYPSDYHVVSSQMGSGSLAEFVGDRHQAYADTSPESEVIHPASDIDPTNDISMYINQKACGVNGVRSQNDCSPNSHSQDNIDSATYAAPSALIPSLSLCSQPINPIQGKENGGIQGHSLESAPEILEKSDCGFDCVRNARSEQNNQTGASGSKFYKRKTKKKTQKEAQGQELQADCQLLKVADSRCPEETLEAELEICRQYQALTADYNEKSTGAICTEAKNSKSRPKLKDYARSKQHDSFRRNKKKSNSLSKSKKNKEKSLHLLAPGEGPSTPRSETAESKRIMHMNNLHKSQGAENAGALLDSGKISCESTTLINADQGLQGFGPLEERQCWVRCDDCFKWRFIPTVIADTLGEDCKWTCKDNIDKDFADCVVPQAKSDAEINAELGISDEEEYNTAKPQFRISMTAKAAKPQAPWTLIRSNLFLHRNRKKQNIDEVMVCQCRPPQDGSLGCGDACLNRMLNIECVRGTCPCGDLCSNQQFQRRKYAKLKWFRCGKKGYGLQVLQNVPPGKFLIEYVGEVLDMVAYEARQREYASGGQRHFYFMTLNGSEVIDACYKGNMGRFINHSCNPNCRTEKWMVNGEVCIGLFAIREIKKGEEVTFDYNYVRVFGAAAKKCFCGSSDCRGYIGGDPLNAENIVQGDSDEEFPEPVMLKDDARSLKEVKRQDAINMESTRIGGHEKDADDRGLEFVPLKYLQSSETVVNPLSKPPIEVKYDSLSDEKTQTTALTADAPLEVEVPPQVAETNRGSALETFKPVVGEDTRQPITKIDNEELAKSVVSAKSCVPSVLAKNNRSGATKNLGRKGKKMVIGGHGCHFEGVDGKLNELLDANGGISKHKDATKGYLRLLVLTAASGDNAESEAIQSTRDMSLILDALLKTKSQKVLMDVMDKNGMQMLHNILKQSRRNEKVPILRKLLKVFEYLALKKVLTVEHINTPSRKGVDSFRCSIKLLTHHPNTQVYQSARSFHDTWMCRLARKLGQLERSNCRLELHNTSSCGSLLSSKRHCDQLMKDADKILLTSPSIICGSDVKSDLPPTNEHNPLANENLGGQKRRRRRTRWDRDEPVFVDSTDPQCSVSYRDNGVAAAAVNTKSESCSDPEILNSVSRREREHFGSTGSSVDNFSMQDVDEIPPGFDFPSLTLHASKNPVCSVGMPDAHNDVVTGIVQERYLPHLAISRGIPIQLMQQFGIPANEGGDGFYSWTVAPGMPFHPFPPLPPFPRKKLKTGHPPVLECAGVSQSHNDMMASGSTEVSPSARSISSSPSEPSLPSTSGRTSYHSRSYSSLNSQTVKRSSPMTNAMGDSFRYERCQDHRSNGFKTAWPREKNRHQVTGTKRCRTEYINDGDILEKGDGSGAGDSPYRG